MSNTAVRAPDPEGIALSFPVPLDLYDIIEHCTGRRPTSDADELRDSRGDWLTWMVTGRLWGHIEAAYEIRFGYIVLDGEPAWTTVGDVRRCVDRLLWGEPPRRRSRTIRNRS